MMFANPAKAHCGLRWFGRLPVVIGR